MRCSIKKFKWIIGALLVFGLGMFLFESAHAENTSKTIGGITYRIPVSNDYWYVSECNEDASGAITIRSEINGIPVTSISKEAFYNCREITSIKIPNTVQFIGEQAFANCVSLNIVYIENIVSWCNITFADELANPLIGNVKLYVNNEEVRNLVIPEEVQKISRFAFYDWSEIQSLTVLGSSTTIEGYAFYSCYNLKNIKIPNGVSQIGGLAFAECTGLSDCVLSGNIQEVGYDAFANCHVEKIYISDIKEWCEIDFSNPEANPIRTATLYLNDEVVNELKIPKEVTSIGDYAFYSYSGLTNMEFSEGLTSIGAYAFCACKGFTKLKTPSSLQSIGEGAFSSCAIADIELAEGLKSIGRRAFAYCELTQVIIPDSVSSIGAAFMGNPIEKLVTPILPSDGLKGMFQYYDQYHYTTQGSVPTTLTEVVITKATGIVDEAFADMDHLKKVELPETVTKIGINAFRSCTGLTEIKIPDNVTSIGASAFNYCSGLREIRIPDGTNVIGQRVFYKCNSLKKITLPYVGYQINATNTKYIGYLFGASTAGRNAEYVPSSLREVVITKDTTIIESAFANCMYLNKIILPESILSIENYAFDGCTNLQTIEIHNQELTIGAEAFSYCDEVVIHCYPNSTAHLYADNNDISYKLFYIIGDLNKDNTITSQDAIYILYHTFFPEKYPLNQGGDFDGSGSVDSKDAIYILYYTFFPTKYPLSK